MNDQEPMPSGHADEGMPSSPAFPSPALPKVAPAHRRARVVNAAISSSRAMNLLEVSMPSNDQTRFATPSPVLAMLLWTVATTLLCAAEGTPFTQPWGMIIPIICVARRRHAIGGWLLFFHISNFTGLLTSLVFVGVGSANYLPQAWGGQNFLYAAFLFQMIPGLLLLVSILVLAEKLRLSRDARWLMPLRTALWLNFAHSVATVVADGLWFELEASMALDVLAVCTSGAWATYFVRSKRVRSVYVDGDWPAPTT